MFKYSIFLISFFILYHFKKNNFEFNFTPICNNGLTASQLLQQLKKLTRYDCNAVSSCGNKVTR